MEPRNLKFASLLFVYCLFDAQGIHECAFKEDLEIILDKYLMKLFGIIAAIRLECNVEVIPRKQLEISVVQLDKYI